MSENALETLQHAIQDVIAPDVRELKVRLASLEKQMDVRFAGVDEKFTAMNEKMDTQFRSLSEKSDIQFKALMAAIGETKAQAELTTLQLISSLSEYPSSKVAGRQPNSRPALRAATSKTTSPALQQPFLHRVMMAACSRSRRSGGRS